MRLRPALCSRTLARRTAAERGRRTSSPQDGNAANFDTTRMIDAPHCHRPATDKAPAWVSNEMTRLRTRAPIVVRVVRLTHRFLVRTFVLLLPVAVMWSWIGPPGDYAIAFRIAST